MPSKNSTAKKNRSKTRSKSREYNKELKKFVRTNRLPRLAERQEREHKAHNLMIKEHMFRNPKMGQNYTERQFMGLQAANYTRRSKPVRTAFRSNPELRKIFDQFNKHWA